jgi:2-dehydro-3-deoxyphosphooctonate aldolase (KDO 8-P synthase)
LSQNTPNPVVAVGNVVFGNARPLSIIAGPCQIESRDHAFECAHALKEITGRLGVGFVFKSSYDKANRTSLSGARGVGLDAALQIFADIGAELSVPILTDVHEREHCAVVAEVVDVLQIPAFLCRQTDLLIAAASNRAATVPARAASGSSSPCWRVPRSRSASPACS